jgi:flagellar basal body-associated protein FliL
MTEEVGTPFPSAEGPEMPSAQKPKKRNTTLIIILVVLILLCLCCAFVLVMYFWLGDLILQWLESQGIQVFMLPALV